jgi:hypothetical protein
VGAPANQSANDDLEVCSSDEPTAILGERQRFSRSAPLPLEHFTRKLNVSHYRARIPARRVSAHRALAALDSCRNALDGTAMTGFGPRRKCSAHAGQPGPFKVDLVFEKIASFSRRAIVGV